MVHQRGFEPRSSANKADVITTDGVEVIMSALSAEDWGSNLHR